MAAEQPVSITAEEAAALLERSGLSGPEFDPAEVARTLESWLRADARLDELLDGLEEEPPPGGPAGFDPRWL